MPVEGGDALAPVCMSRRRFDARADEIWGAPDAAAADALRASDLTPTVYEGGFKVWECAFDLLRVMRAPAFVRTLPRTRVLELGCGHALPGIFAMMCGASVTLQDYVRGARSCASRRRLTRPLARRAVPRRSGTERRGAAHDHGTERAGQLRAARAGARRSAATHRRRLGVDGRTLCGLCGALRLAHSRARARAPRQTLLGDEQFDLMLCSDTLYYPEAHRKHVDLIGNHLAPGGKAYVAPCVVVAAAR